MRQQNKLIHCVHLFDTHSHIVDRVPLVDTCKVIVEVEILILLMIKGKVNCSSKWMIQWQEREREQYCSQCYLTKLFDEIVFTLKKEVSIYRL
jgi:hypothetical protein